MKEVIKDIICQVLVREKSKELIYLVLNEFLPNYEPLHLDYTGKPDDKNYEFESEDEMISCYIDTNGVSQTFYWNKHENNPNKIMIGVKILEDHQMVFSLTLDGTEEKAATCFKQLKNVLNSEIGVISYIDPVDYKNGQDFYERYGTDLI